MTSRETIIPEGSEQQYERFHFAPAVRVGDTVRLSGVIGTKADGSVDADPEQQFVAAFESVVAVLEAADATAADIVDITSYHVGLDALGTFMKVKDRFVSEPYPTWTAIGVSALAIPGAIVEIQVTAVT